MVKLSAQEIYNKLVNEYQLIGKTGHIEFVLNNLSVMVDSNDTVGNLLQSWFIKWLNENEIISLSNPNPQKFPDFFLDPNDTENGLLEVKTFNMKRSPGFDIANFDSYCNSLKTDAYRLDSDYLIFGYKMNGGLITIENVWLKKVWEISGPSGPWPVKVQDKRNVIYNLRPVTWYSKRKTFRPFGSKELFLENLNETRYQYPQTRNDNARWLDLVLDNYKKYTDVELIVKRH